MALCNLEKGVPSSRQKSLVPRPRVWQVEHGFDFRPHLPIQLISLVWYPFYTLFPAALISGACLVGGLRVWLPPSRAYNWPLNNTSLNFEGSLIWVGFFSGKYTVIPPYPQVSHPRIQLTADWKQYFGSMVGNLWMLRANLSYTWIFDYTPNPMLFNCNMYHRCERSRNLYPIYALW